ncbi:MAG: hypothetical protein ACC613_08720 [Synergistales bacterium]
MSPKLGWFIVLSLVAIAVSMVVVFVKIMPTADVLGVTLDPVGGGEAVQTSTFAGKPTVLIFFTPT